MSIDFGGALERAGAPAAPGHYNPPRMEVAEGGGTSHETYVRYLHKAGSLVVRTFCESRLER
jgi:hypothetical protein